MISYVEYIFCLGGSFYVGRKMLPPVAFTLPWSSEENRELLIRHYRYKQYTVQHN